MPRVNIVRKARKARRCGRCGDTINPGEGYRYWSFRFGGTYIRCMKSECSPRPSDLTQSKMADAYSAQESAQDELNKLRADDPGDQDTVTSVVETFAESVRSVADEYREADEAIGGGGYTESGERADALETVADELEGFSPATVMDEVDPCEACAELRQSAWDELIDEAWEAVDSVSWDF
jgi:hypothetical protein